MPKRQNPFGECSPLQLKSHVSLKDVERTQSDTMNSVYEKTKALLFQGSRKKDSESCDHANLDDLNISRQQMLHPLPGQLTLNNNCAISEKVEIPEKTPGSSACVAMEMEISEMELLPGQMFIDSSGHIQRNQLETASTSTTKKESVMSCSLCTRSCSHKMHVCTDCGRDICVVCVQQCYVCENPFCRFCATINPDDYLERVVCHSCKEHHIK